MRLEKTALEAHKRGRVLAKEFGDEEHWNVWEMQRKIPTMMKGIELKFTQNPYLMQQLLLTEDNYLVEANPYDQYWGGITADSLNLLGKLIMHFRDAVGFKSKGKIVPLMDADISTEHSDPVAQFQSGVETQGEYKEMFDDIEKDTISKKKGVKVRERIKPGTSFLPKQQALTQQEKANITSVSPFMFLTTKERQLLFSQAVVRVVPSDAWIIDMKDQNDKWNAFIMLQGDASAINKQDRFVERIKEMTFFGVDGPLFHKR